MFIPIYQLQGYDQKESERVTDRWNSSEGRKHREMILGLIRQGAGEDFLQYYVESGPLGHFLDDMWDLKGFSLFKEEIDFPTADNFEAIDFSYARFYHCILRNCCLNASFRFAKIYNCQFIDCVFNFSHWYGATIEKSQFSRCDFVNFNKFINCSFIGSQIKDFSTANIMFADCQFDAGTSIDVPQLNMVLAKGQNQMKDTELSGYYKALEEGYAAGGVPELSRKYHFLSRKARNDFLSENRLSWLATKIFVELLTGYGVEPSRPIIGAVITILIFACLFWVQQGSFYKAFLLSSSAFVTIDSASLLPFPFNFLYVVESLFGIVFLALLVTVLANVWFSYK